MSRGADLMLTLPPTLPGETPWFSWDQKPVQIGVYRRVSLSGVTMYSLWDGEHWRWNRTNVFAAHRSAERSLIQTLPWCGLLYPPEGGYR